MAPKTDDNPEQNFDPAAEAPVKRGKQIGASFTEEEYAGLRKARFRLELDKDTEVIKLAVAEYVDKVLASQP